MDRIEELALAVCFFPIMALNLFLSVWLGWADNEILFIVYGLLVCDAIVWLHLAKDYALEKLE